MKTYITLLICIILCTISQAATLIVKDTGSSKINKGCFEEGVTNIEINLVENSTDWEGYITKRETNNFNGISIEGTLKNTRNGFFIISKIDNYIMGTINDGNGHSWKIEQANETIPIVANSKKCEIKSKSLETINNTIKNVKKKSNNTKELTTGTNYNNYDLSRFIVNDPSISPTNRFIAPEPTNTTTLKVFVIISGFASGLLEYWGAQDDITSGNSYMRFPEKGGQCYHGVLTFPQMQEKNAMQLARIDLAFREANAILKNQNTKTQLELSGIYDNTNSLWEGVDYFITGVTYDQYGTDSIISIPSADYQTAYAYQTIVPFGWLDEYDIVIFISQDAYDDYLLLGNQRHQVNDTIAPNCKWTDDINNRFVWIDWRGLEPGNYILLTALSGPLGLGFEKSIQTKPTPFTFGNAFQFYFTNAYQTNISLMTTNYATNKVVISGGQVFLPDITNWYLPWTDRFQQLTDWYPNFTSCPTNKNIIVTNGGVLVYYNATNKIIQSSNYWVTNIIQNNIQYYETLTGGRFGTNVIRIPFFSGTNTFTNPNNPDETIVLQNTDLPITQREDNERALRLIAPYIQGSGTK